MSATTLKQPVNQCQGTQPPSADNLLPVQFVGDTIYTDVSADSERPVLFVDASAPAELLVSAAKLRVNLLDKLVTIATCWNSPFEDDVNEFGQLLAPLVGEANVFLDAILAKGGAQ